MRVILAHSAGFCMGVRRAVNKAFITLRHNQGPIYTYGPLIHNPQVISLLERRGVTKIREGGLESCDDGIVIIRAHGISPKERREIDASGLDVVDATCPKVMRVHTAVIRHNALGYLVVVAGDKDHPEVMGILGHTDGEGVVVSSPTDVDKIPKAEKILLVVQTTFDVETFYEIKSAVEKRFGDLEVKVIDTICDSTKKRQDEVRELAKKVDAIFVVGGKESGNTKRLFGVARGCGVPAFLVEDETEINPDDLSAFETVGLTAGASTPNWVIMKVYDYLSGLEGARLKGGRIWRALSGMTRSLVLSNVYAGISAGGLAVSAALLLGVESIWTMPLISGLFIFSMLVLNRIQDTEALKFNDPLRERFNKTNKVPLVILGVFSSVTSAALSYTISPLAFMLLILAILIGVAYSVKVIPKPLAKYTKYRRLKDIPASKTFFVAGAWAGVSAGMPYLSAVGEISFVSFSSVFFFCFLLVFIRAALFDMRDIQGDAVVGRETIPIVLGKELTQRLLVVLLAVVSLVLTFSAMWGLVTPLGYWLLVIPVYCLFTLYLYHRRVIFQGIPFEIVVDLEFILAGILAAVWTFTI